jgi:phosphoribosylpyrophosphate synthetase
VASKFRPDSEKILSSEIIGEFTGKKIAIVLDDLIATGGTVSAVISELVTRKSIASVYLATSHHLYLSEGCERLRGLADKYKLKKFVTTNSIPSQEPFSSLPFVQQRCLSSILCQTINCIHYDRSVSELFFET